MKPQPTADHTSKKRVLHLCVDFPSRNRPINTQAVRNLIAANPEVEHRIFALTRSANPLAINALEGDEQGDHRVTSMRYWGLPFGLFHLLSLYLLAWRIRRYLEQENTDFALIHGHKLAFEGLAAYWLSRWLNVPLAVSVRGEADLKVLRFLPHCRPLLQSVLDHAQAIYHVSAWFKVKLNHQFAIDDRKQALLPNFVTLHPWQLSHAHRPDHLVTVMDLNVWRKKGADRLITAIAKLKHKHPKLKLDIYGRGEPQAKAQVQALIAHAKVDQRVKLMGEISNQQLLNCLPDYAGLALLSHRETFGMIYIEALLSGIPIVHSRHTGIDGFVDGIPARSSADPDDLDAIIEAIDQLLRGQYCMRQWLQRHHAQLVQRFGYRRYIQNYNQRLELIYQTND